MRTRRAIPTVLGGVRFRSRLEARWALMFDQLGWKWEYEPIDLDGYIPDFMLLFPVGPMLVEVKPEFTVLELIAAAATKIDLSGWRSANTNDALVVGATWQPEDADYQGPAVGALRQRYDDLVDSWAPGMWQTCRACGRPSIYHVEQGWQCAVCGAYDGDGYLGPPPDELEATWQRAGNAVQWRR